VLRTRLIWLSLIGALAMLMACDTRVNTEPQYQPQVINLRNDFALQVSNLAGLTQDVEYSWVSDSTAATITQSPTLLTGTAMIFVFDGTGAQVYQRSLAENGTFTTSGGAPGTWKVLLKFDEANGGVGVRLTAQ
jgi:hypothetical protein